jgi:trans-aconitate methyltransferase
MDLLEARQRGIGARERHPWELARLEVVRGLIGRHVRLSAGTAVLDIGCGDTFVVEQIAATFPEVIFYAVDTAFTDESIAQYRARLRVPNVFMSSSLDSAVPHLDRPVSLVILMDVLEHIEHDQAFLTHLLARPRIGSSSHVLVTVPSYQALFCSHDELLGHYRRYSNQQLRELLESSGLAVIEIGYFFSTLVLARAVQTIKERWLITPANDSATTGLVTWNRGKPLTALVKGLLLADVRLSRLLRQIGITLPGLSNYAICRKSA